MLMKSLIILSEVLLIGPLLAHEKKCRQKDFPLFEKEEAPTQQVIRGVYPSVSSISSLRWNPEAASAAHHETVALFVRRQFQAKSPACGPPCPLTPTRKIKTTGRIFQMQRRC